MKQKCKRHENLLTNVDELCTCGGTIPDPVTPVNEGQQPETFKVNNKTFRGNYEKMLVEWQDRGEHDKDKAFTQFCEHLQIDPKPYPEQATNEGQQQPAPIEEGEGKQPVTDIFKGKINWSYTDEDKIFELSEDIKELEAAGIDPEIIDSYKKRYEGLFTSWLNDNKEFFGKIDGSNAKEKAKLIVTAVNNFPDMYKALKEIVFQYEETAKLLEKEVGASFKESDYPSIIQAKAILNRIN